MNYIKQMNAIFSQFYKDSRLNPTHISLYFSLFQMGNINRFPETFHINREEVMKLSKIGSKGTYHRCLKQLDQWGYIKCLPSHNPYKGSKIKLHQFQPEPGEESRQITVPKSGQPVYRHRIKNETSSEQASGPFNKHDKTYTNLLNLKKEEVCEFLKSEFQKTIPEEKLSAAAENFINHNRATGWLIGKKPIKDWQAAARNWMFKALEIERNKTSKQNHQKHQETKTTTPHSKSPRRRGSRQSKPKSSSKQHRHHACPPKL